MRHNETQASENLGCQRVTKLCRPKSTGLKPRRYPLIPPQQFSSRFAAGRTLSVFFRQAKHFRPDAFNRPQRGFDPRGAESVGTQVPPLFRAPRLLRDTRFPYPCMVRGPPWPPPGGGIRAATRAILAHPRFRTPAVPGGAPCIAPPGAPDRIGRVRLADVPCRARGPASQVLHRRGCLSLAMRVPGPCGAASLSAFYRPGFPSRRVLPLSL